MRLCVTWDVTCLSECPPRLQFTPVHLRSLATGPDWKLKDPVDGSEKFKRTQELLLLNHQAQRKKKRSCCTQLCSAGVARRCNARGVARSGDCWSVRNDPVGVKEGESENQRTWAPRCYSRDLDKAVFFLLLVSLFTKTFCNHMIV